MPQIKGRGIRKPTVGEVFMGEMLVVRIDDRANPITWMTLAFTPAEFGAMFDRYADWLRMSEQHAALRALTERS